MSKYDQRQIYPNQLLNKSSTNIYIPKEQVDFNTNPFLNKQSSTPSISENYINSLSHDIFSGGNYAALQEVDDNGVPTSDVYTAKSNQNAFATLQKDGHAEKLALSDYLNNQIANWRRLNLINYAPNLPHSSKNLRRTESLIPKTKKNYTMFPPNEDLSKENSYLNPIQQYLEEKKAKLLLLSDRELCKQDEDEFSDFRDKNGKKIHCSPFMQQILPQGSQIGYFNRYVKNGALDPIIKNRKNLEEGLTELNKQRGFRALDKALDEELTHYENITRDDPKAIHINDFSVNGVNASNGEYQQVLLDTWEMNEKRRRDFFNKFEKLRSKDNSLPQLSENEPINTYKPYIEKYKQDKRQKERRKQEQEEIQMANKRSSRSRRRDQDYLGYKKPGSGSDDSRTSSEIDREERRQSRGRELSLNKKKYKNNQQEEESIEDIDNKWTKGSK